jgi:predicted RNA polymerase sigma factor
MLVLLTDQDRSLWDGDEIAEGLALTERALSAGPGVYILQAAIAAEHARAGNAEDTDWQRIVRLYDWLARVQPTPVVELNRAVAVAMASGPEAGLELIDAIDGLDRYRHLHSARADLLRRLGREADAAEAYRRAADLADNPVERAFLARRLEELGAAS